MADGEMKPVNRRLKLAEVKAHPRNYNAHPQAQVERIAASLRKFGQVRSIVVWRSLILAGHGVVEAARLLGWPEVTADVLPDDYPEHLALAYVAADNELARQGEPDLAQLAAILEESAAADAELIKAIGYSDEEYKALLKDVIAAQEAASRTIGDTEPQIDRAEELRQKWGVEPGQLWQLGEHRLICGDCTDAAVVARVMGGERFVLITDPPYGIDASKMTMGIKQSSLPKDQRLSNVAAWDGKRPDISALMKDAVHSCIWGAQYFAHDLPLSGDWLCWDKKNYACSFSEVELAWTDYDINTRIIQHHWSGEEKLHITQKPLPVVMWTIRICPDASAIVFDPFSGSGTTLIACENLGRRCRAVEISPAYVAVALERWATHTGRTPVLVSAAGSEA